MRIDSTPEELAAAMFGRHPRRAAVFTDTPARTVR